MCSFVDIEFDRNDDVLDYDKNLDMTCDIERKIVLHIGDSSDEYSSCELLEFIEIPIVYVFVADI